MNTSLSIKKGASQAQDSVQAVDELYLAINQPNASMVLFYCSPHYDLNALADAINAKFAGANIIGCTTAGEITPIGYLEGSLTGVSIASEDFSVAITRIDEIKNFSLSSSERAVNSTLLQLESMDKVPDANNTFGFVLIDGLSMQEEFLVSGLHQALDDIQLFGGSAGDGINFNTTYIFHKGKFHTNCAVLTLIHTTHPFQVFKTEHFVSTEDKMVVTEADPVRRIVFELNGEPAASEYANIIGLDVNDLSPQVFATNPIVVKVGGQHFVRSIQKANNDGSLTFYCAIDTGIVLTIGKGVDLVSNLEELFGRIEESIGHPQIVFGCDCILRNLEVSQKNMKEKVGNIFVKNNVIGFSTYGEQLNAMHMNQTFTGVAIG